MARTGTEYLTSNKYIAFPFKEDALGLVRTGDAPVHGVTATLPLDFFIDAVLVLPDSVGQVYLDSIRRIRRGEYTLLFKNAAGDEVIQLPYTLGTEPIKGYKLLSAQNVVKTTTLRLLVTAAFEQHLETVASLDTFDQRLPLEDVVLDIRPPRVESFELYKCLPAAPEPTKPGPITGAVKFAQGYNWSMSFDDEQDALTDLTTLEVAAIPGAGIGLYPCQHESEAVLTVFNRIRPGPMNDIQLEGDDCYQILPNPETGVIQLHGRCYQCCTCRDYANTAKALGQKSSATQSVCTSFNELYNMYVSAVNQYQRMIDKIRVAGVIVDAQYVLVGKADKYQWITGIIAVTNMGVNDIATSIRFSLSIEDNDAKIKRVQPFNATAGSDGTFTANLKPGDVAGGKVIWHVEKKGKVITVMRASAPTGIITVPILPVVMPA